MVHRIYTEKKPPFAQEAASLLAECRDILGLKSITGLRILERYDAEGISPELFAACRDTVFSEPPLDDCFAQLPADAAVVIARELLPGQFDQLADSCAQCIQFVSGGERPLVATARVFLLYGDLSPSDTDAVKKHLINPVECREACLELPDTLDIPSPQAGPIPLVEGFLDMDEAGLNALRRDQGLAMDEADLLFCREHFRKEGRCPTYTELRVIDTYWSDHCRHTTFNTELTPLDIQDEQAAAAYSRYQSLRREMGVEKPVTLMDIATIGARYLRRQGRLPHLDE
ncbi:MAG: phosphoribosylformylglycinamidine synthase, partial [Clostridiales bacterium]|nr:phosphoribosylformylglycinamidine synthase [Clostridiales bacterium]